MPSLSHSRRGVSTAVVMIALCLTAVVLGGFYVYASLEEEEFSIENIVMQKAEKKRFVFSVTEKGEVESSRSVEIRCDVKARGSAGTTILEVVPEGTEVAAGDFIVQLDSSLLELDLNAQEIRLHTSEAAMIKAENDYEVAVIAKTEYQEGTFKESQQSIQNDIFLAKEDLRRSEQYLDYSKRLAAKGYVTSLQLEADQFAVDKARGSLSNSRTKLQVLEEYTRPKMVTQLESDVESKKVGWESAKSSYELESSKFKEIQEQINRCRIVAPQAGQVKYANRRSRGGDVIIEAGLQVRQGQVIVRLPDPDSMQIEADINEASTKHVKMGMPCTILISSVSTKPMHGRVVKINDYPEPGAWFSSNVKEYETKISIDDPVENLKLGLTAEVKIQVKILDEAVQLPLQSVLEHHEKYYCLQADGNQLKRVEVVVGFNNEDSVVIESGLLAGDKVVENPRHYRQHITWPELDETEQEDELMESPQPRDPEKSASKWSGQNRDPKQAVIMIMQNLDRDKDDRISKQEIDAAGAYRDKLRLIDTNADGFIDRDELTGGLAKLRGGSS